ncbi:GNAT family N-acetyltransferase [Methanomicrobium mobile]|uniref:GNAT family N-acetyltransferase n=1 Tax=Methanomicrobium mobile TaxID=2205 RepID=UPI0005B2D9A8|nr:GNAT family N-acetyltransferase [Methanomicrobium mobile]
MSTVTIKILNENEKERWDDIVKRSPHSTPVHLYDWLKIIETYTNTKLYLFVGYIGDEIVAAIPLFYSKKHFFKILSSPPANVVIQNLGLIIPEYNSLKQDKREYYFREFMTEFNKYLAKTIKPDVVSIVTPPGLVDARPYNWNNYIVTPKYNYVCDISDLEIVWKNFKKTLRKNIEKASKLKFSIEEGDIYEYIKIYEFVVKRLSDQGRDATTPCEYFRSLYQTISKDTLKNFVAKLDGEVVTGIIVFGYHEKISIWVGATQVNMPGLYPVDLLQWEIIKWASDHGYKYCEILGANTQSISYFKSRYNFDLEIYYSAEYYGLKAYPIYALRKYFNRLVNYRKKSD